MNIFLHYTNHRHVLGNTHKKESNQMVFLFVCFFMTAIRTAAQVMGLVHVPYSRQLHTHLISHQWCLTQMSHAGVLELKCKTYQCAPQVSYTF